MTEKTTKPATRRRTTKTTQPKKEAEPKVEATQEAPVEQAEEKVESKPKRQKRVEIDRNEMIATRSSVNGLLIYISPRSKEKYTWDDFGSVEYMEMGELMTMKSSSPKFLKDAQLIIDDEEAAEYLGLTKVYENLIDLDDLNDFFDKSTDEIAKVLPKLPEGLKRAIATRARALAEDGTLDSLGKIKIIEQELDVDIQMFIKKD